MTRKSVPDFLSDNLASVEISYDGKHRIYIAVVKRETGEEIGRSGSTKLLSAIQQAVDRSQDEPLHHCGYCSRIFAIHEECMTHQEVDHGCSK